MHLPGKKHEFEWVRGRNGFQIRVGYHINENEWDNIELAIIKSAFGILRERWFDPNIESYAKDQATKIGLKHVQYYYKQNNLPEKIDIRRIAPPTSNQIPSKQWNNPDLHHVFGLLLHNQLQAIENFGAIDVNIRPYSKVPTDDWWETGRAYVATQKVAFKSEKPSRLIPTRDNELFMFDIELNRDAMGKESGFGESLNAVYWAGTIAHEMLHNIGHTHPGTVGNPESYKGWFIREFENAIINNGEGGEFKIQNFGLCGCDNLPKKE